MKPIDQYNSLDEFTTDLDSSPADFVPFKVFGPKVPAQKGRSAEFHTITMLNYIYKNIENPDSITWKSLWWAPFGEVNRRGTRLNPATTYSSIKPHTQGNNIFQGDILEFDNEIGGNAPTKFGAVFSHSCEVPREKYISVLPVYFESQITDAIASELANKTILAANLKNIIQGWFSNENKRFIGLPAVRTKDDDERILIHLRPVHLINSTTLPAGPLFRLTYRALSYFQLRIAHFFIRDVQNSDETRQM